MKQIYIILFSLIIFVLSSCSKNNETQTKINSKYIAYYFHPTARCESCINLENYIKEIIETKYAKEGFVFKPINIEDNENEHFRKDYDLKFSSVILVNIKSNNWKNMDSIWSYTGDKDKFFNYAETEINNFTNTNK